RPMRTWGSTSSHRLRSLASAAKVHELVRTERTVQTRRNVNPRAVLARLGPLYTAIASPRLDLSGARLPGRLWLNLPKDGPHRDHPLRSHHYEPILDGRKSRRCPP